MVPITHFAVICDFSPLLNRKPFEGKSSVSFVI